MKSLFIFIENFYPAYKGGGPIQSVTNLIILLHKNFNVFVITSAYDLKSKVILENIIPDSWNEIMLPGANKNIKVWYSKAYKYQFFTKFFKENNPDLLYFNGIFSLRFFILPLIAIRSLHKTPKIIICPRGMLQKGAVANNSFKKIIYLKALKFAGLVNKVRWHATNVEEKTDIITYFSANNRVYIANNIPKKPLEKINIIKKNPESLKLVYLSLITEKKNLYFLLTVIRNTENITLDIFGPVKDIAYWNRCNKIINEIPEKVKYKGDILPLNVQDTISEYHGMILLTKGENFGHALYESLSVGRPIITSEFTPWNNLQNIRAGWNVNINSMNKCLSILNEFYSLPQDKYDLVCVGAHKVAKEYYTTLDSSISYKPLFT